MEDDMTYDEDKAIAYIRSTLSKEVSEQYSDDEILYIIDVIWDYYEKNGFLTIDAAESDDDNLDVDKMTAYVKKEIQKDGEILMDPADVEAIVKGELQYEESLEDFV